MKKLNREYPLDINKYIDVKYGSIDREHPLVVYLEGKSWICPQTTSFTENSINCIIEEFKNEVKEKLVGDEHFCRKFFFDFDIKTASLRENKKSFMSFEFLVRQNGKVNSLPQIKDEMTTLFKGAIENLVTNLESHVFSLSKRK